MALDLTLLIIDSNYLDKFPCAHTMLSCERDYDLFSAIKTTKYRKDVPEDFSSFLSIVPDGSHEGEYGYGTIATDRYSVPLTMVRAKHLLKFSKHEAVINNWKNKAIWAYLEQIPNQWVVLYWR